MPPAKAKVHSKKLSHKKPLLDSLEKIFEMPGVLIVGLNNQGRITLFNKGCEKLTGYKRQELLGRSIFTTLLPKEQRSEVRNVFKDLKHTKMPSLYVHDWVTKKGERRTIEWHNTITLDQNGVLASTFSIGIDITEKKKAEAEHRSLFETVPVGLFRTKPGIGEILDVNPALVKILGYPDKETLIKMKASSFYVDPNTRQQWERKVAKNGVVRGFEAQFRRLDGRLIWVRFSSRAVRNSSGKVIFYEGTLEDITDRKHAQEALAESEERYRLFFENLTDVLLQLDKNLTIVDVSPSIEQHLGYHPDELKGKSYPSLNLIPPELISQALENTKRLFAGEHVGPKEYPFLAKDGTRIWGEVSSKQVIRDGETIALYSLVRDIHDRKLAEIELKNNNRDLELYATLLRHDLGNDLQVIFSATEVAQMMTSEDSELKEFIEATRVAAERMTRLLDIFGRPEKEAEKEIVALIRRVANDAMKTHQHLTIKIKAPQKISGVRVIGGRLLPTVFVNIFRNAAQHAGPDPVVNVRIAQKDNRVKIDVVDNGLGIPKKLKAKLFERGTTTTGTGLGLNLSKRVLEAYGGSIELITKPYTKGAAFRIFLPIEET